LIVVYSSGSVPLGTWADIFARLRARGLDAAYVGMGLDPENLSNFDGLHSLGVFDVPDFAAKMKAVGRQVRYWNLLAEVPSAKIWVGTAEPGFDDRLTPWSNNRFKDRENGALYRSTFEAAIQSDPDWILIDN